MSWSILEDEFKKDYFLKLCKKLDEEYKQFNIYPKKEEVFNAFRLTGFKDSKVLILGQDPYHGKNQAHGIAFSVNPGISLPPSLKNIFIELENDLNIKMDTGDLRGWAREGVLLLNAHLTVREASPGSHKSLGWEILTDKIISLLNKKEEPMVFILWGNQARQKKKLISNSKHLILESVHPSPLSAYRGFFGSKPFSKTNDFLIANNREPINWGKKYETR